MHNHFKKYWPFFALTIAGCHFTSLCNSFFYLFLKVEFVGGPMCWNTRTFSASAGINCSKTELGSLVESENVAYCRYLEILNSCRWWCLL